MKSLIMLLVLALCVVPVCQAASSATISVSATVPNSLELSWGMAKVDSKLTDDSTDDTWTPNQTAMAFGDLRHYLANNQEAGIWFSQYYFPIFMSAITGGSKYKIQQTSSGLAKGAVKLPKAWGIAYIACWDTANNREVGCPEGATKGQPGPAEASNKVIYDSGTGAAMTTVRADYAIPLYKTGGGDPFPGYEPIPLNQQYGTYSGSVTISVVTY